MALYCRSVRRRIIASGSLQQAIILILLSVILTILCLKLYLYLYYENTLDQDQHLDGLKAHVSGHGYMRSHTDGDPADVHGSSLTHNQQKHRGEKTLNVIVVDEHHEGGGNSYNFLSQSTPVNSLHLFNAFSILFATSFLTRHMLPFIHWDDGSTNLWFVEFFVIWQ